MKNTPYVKEYKDGILMNPIKGSYLNAFLNRSQRRDTKHKFYGESKNYHLTVLKNCKFKRVKQYTVNKEGGKKVVLHYLPC